MEVVPPTPETPPKTEETPKDNVTNLYVQPVGKCFEFMKGMEADLQDVMIVAIHKDGTMGIAASTMKPALLAVMKCFMDSFIGKFFV